LQKKSESKGLQLLTYLAKTEKFKKDYKTMILNGHNMGITSLSLSPDGSKLASGSFDGTVIIWDIKTGRRSLYAKDMTLLLTALHWFLILITA